MVLPFPQKWANAADRRAPNTQENANGYACGSADPALFNYLEYTAQDAINKVARQIEYASDQLGFENYSVGDEAALHDILVTYKDIITDNRVINVPADYSDIADAMDYLSQFRIANSAQVIVNVAAGTYNHGTKVISGHPDGLRILVQGPALATGMPTEAGFQVTGATPSNVAADRIVNDSMLRGKFQGSVVIQTTNGGVDTGTGSLTLKNLLFIGQGANEGIKTGAGRIICENVAVHNYFDNYKVDRSGVIVAPSCTSSGAVQHGFSVENNGVIDNTSGVSSGNLGSGYFTTSGGTIIAKQATSKGNGDASGGGGFFVSLFGFINGYGATSKNNAGYGFSTTTGGIIQARESISQNNGSVGYNVFNGGLINAAASVSTTNTTNDYRCQNIGDMIITGYGGTASASPSVNTVGNGNCYIKN